MQNYKRNVTYFYQYHNGMVGTTAGFLKMEIRGEQVKLTINIQEAPRHLQNNPALYFYHEAGDHLAAVKVGEVGRQGGVLTMQTKTSWQQVFDTGRDLYTFDGVLVLYSENDYYLGDFKDRDRRSYDLKFVEQKRMHTDQEESRGSAREENGDMEKIKGRGDERIEHRTARMEMDGADEREKWQDAERRAVVSEERRGAGSGEHRDERSEERRDVENGERRDERVDAERKVRIDERGDGEREVHRDERMNEEWEKRGDARNGERTEEGIDAEREKRREAGNGERIDERRDAEKEKRRDVGSGKSIDERRDTENEEHRDERMNGEREKRQDAGFGERRDERMDAEREACRDAKGEENEDGERDKYQDLGSENRRDLDRVENRNTETNKNRQDFETMLKEYPKLPMYNVSELFDCVRIHPRDIGRLDIGNWKLGSNSFLSHGYYTYQYLMLGRMQFDDGSKHAVLGVPGVYSNRERYLANMFGFEQFIPVKKTGVRTGQFGYWIVELNDCGD